MSSKSHRYSTAIIDPSKVQIIKNFKTAIKRCSEELNDDVYKNYQKITHMSKIDALGERDKKENCEKELDQIQQDI